MNSHHEEAIALIKRLSPLLDEESEVFRELAGFFGHDAKIEVHHGDLGALFSELLRDLLPDATPGTRDQRDFAIKISHLNFLSFCRTAIVYHI